MAGCVASGVLMAPAALAAGPGGGAAGPLADTTRPPAAEVGAAPRPVDRRSAPATRRASRSAFRGLSRGEAVELAQDRFPELRQRAYKSLELGTGERVAQWLGDLAARIDQGAGKPDLL